MFIIFVQACADRIKSDTTGQAHCSGQYFDFWHCVDHCVSTLERLEFFIPLQPNLPCHVQAATKTFANLK